MYPHQDEGGWQFVGAASRVVRRQGGTSPSSAPSSTSSQASGAGSQQDSGGLNKWGLAVLVLVAVIVVFTALLFTYSYLRRQRLQHKIPGYIPGRWLKRKWMAWKPRGKYASLEVQDTPTPLNNAEQVRQPAANVDRHTSVRSIISLPAYSRQPKESEEVIGREGERDGMDTVVEFPETGEEEEDRREEEMESLYQIRQTRRQEIAEREERRRLRREAREAGDYARLEELRQESRQRRADQTSGNGSTANLTAEMLIAEHNARGRDRRVSSVSYAQVGQVRHDGSRVRAGSMESERALLGGAAPMGSVPPLPHSRHGSEATSFLSMNDIPRPSYSRDRSNSGAMSISSVGSSFDNGSRHDIRPTTAGTSASSHRVARSVSSGNTEEVDLGDERLEPTLTAPGSSPMPPIYDAHDWGDAPAYEEQARIARLNSRASEQQRKSPTSSPDDLTRLPNLQVTPVINVQGPSQPNSPLVIRNHEGLGISGSSTSS